MAVLCVNSVQNSVTGTTLNVGYPGGGPVARNLLVMGVRVQNGVTINSITDTLGHSWAATTPESPLTVGSDHKVFIFYIGSCLGGADTVSITTNSSGLICAAIAEFSGLIPFAVQDQHNAATGTSTTPNSGNIDTTSAAEAVVAITTAVAGNHFVANGTPDNWSRREDSGVDKLELFAQQLAAKQAGMNITGTMTIDTWGAMIVSFKAAVSGRRYSSVGDKPGSRTALISNL